MIISVSFTMKEGFIYLFVYCCPYVGSFSLFSFISILQFNKQDISWTQLLRLYEWDVGLKRSSPGLRRLHRISHEHLHLTPSLRMRVYMAAQVKKKFQIIFCSYVIIVISVLILHFVQIRHVALIAMFF